MYGELRRVRERRGLDLVLSITIVELHEQTDKGLDRGRVEAPPEDAEQLELDESYVLSTNRPAPAREARS